MLLQQCYISVSCHYYLWLEMIDVYILVLYRGNFLCPVSAFLYDFVLLKVGRTNTYKAYYQSTWLIEDVSHNDNYRWTDTRPAFIHPIRHSIANYRQLKRPQLVHADNKEMPESNITVSLWSNVERDYMSWWYNVIIRRNNTWEHWFDTGNIS